MASNSNDSSLKVPPIRIVIPTSANNSSPSVTTSTTTSSNNGNTNATAPPATSTTSTSSKFLPYIVTSTDESNVAENENSLSSNSSQRITRSSRRAQQEKQTFQNDSQAPSDDEATPANAPNDAQYPRKRKIRNNNNSNNNKEGDNDNDSSSSSSSLGTNLKEVSPFAMPSTNCYEMFLNIRKQVDKRRKSMFTVHPKPPQGFKDYLINRCSYLLEGKSSSNQNGASTKLSMSSPPSNLSPGSELYQLFSEQEKKRHKMRVQHLIEREKLVLSAEQEILRVHGRAARAIGKQINKMCRDLSKYTFYFLF